MRWVCLLLLLGACVARRGRSDLPRPTSSVQLGMASWYGARHHGRKTANGERFDMHALTAAHLGLPFGTLVRVTNLANGRSVVVRINDRGPYSRGRIIDVSQAAARMLGMIEAGVARVRIEVIEARELAPAQPQR